MADLEKVETFSVDEVNARLPLVRRIVEDLRNSSIRCQQIRTRLRNFQRESVDNHSIELLETMNRLREEEQLLEREIANLEEEANQIGAIVRDPRRGVVDFFSVRSGHLIYLVWTLGEEQVAFWRKLDARLKDKKPISQCSDLSSRMK